MCSISRTLLICAATSAASGLAAATPPSTSPYVTDPQNVYVQDETAQGIGSLNMVLCVIGAMDPGAMVNAGPYLALVDINKCQSAKGGSSAASAGATDFANAVVNVTRASNNDPMIAKVWLSLTEQDQVDQRLRVRERNAVTCDRTSLRCLSHGLHRQGGRECRIQRLHRFHHPGRDRFPGDRATIQ